MDKYLISAAIIFLAFLSGWLLQDLKIVDGPGFFDQSSRVEQGTPLGEVSYIKKQVRRRPNNSLAWQESFIKEDLYSYDTLLTLDQAVAEIKLAGNNQITLNENTLITIEPTDNTSQDEGPVRLRFRHGQMSANTRTPQSLSAGDFVLEAGQNTKLVLRSDENNKFELEAHEGEVKILDPNNTQIRQTLKEGQVIRFAQNKIEDVQTVSKTEWVTPGNGDRYYTHESTYKLAAQWSGPGDRIYIQNQKENSLDEVSVSSESPQSKSLDLKTGSYILKIGAKENLSFGRVVSVLEAPRIYLMKPLPREVLKTGVDVQLLWTLHPDVAKYEWSVSQDPEFKTVLNQEKSSSGQALVKNLKQGRYFWKVQGEDAQGYKIPEFYINDFIIMDKPLAAPKLKNPQIKRESSSTWLKKFWSLIFPQAEAAENHGQYYAEFQWEDVEGADSYFIEISRTPDFKNPLISTQVSKTSFKWRKFPLGTYYWHVAGQQSGIQGMFSEVAYADLRSIPHAPVTAMKPPEPEPLPTPIPAPTPEKKKLKTVEDEAFKPWALEVQTGGTATYGYFKGPDFTVKEMSIAPGVVRVILNSHEASLSWRNEFEGQKVVYKAASATKYPFQTPATRYTGRWSLIHDNPFENEWSWGFAIHNQVPQYKRADYEILDIYNRPYAGVLISKKYYQSRAESELRFGFYGGLGAHFEATARKTWLYNIGFLTDGTVTIELRTTAGYYLPQSFWIEPVLNILLGIRW